MEAFLHVQGCGLLIPASRSGAPSLPQTLMATEAAAGMVPPRMFTDKCVSTFFQEIAPLFPVLHRPTFLHTYGDFVADLGKVKGSHKLAQVYLVFAIAALSGDSSDGPPIAACEIQWQRHLSASILDDTIETLQALVLAVLFCTVRADFKRLQHFKGIAVALSYRLGLHNSQRRLSFGPLIIETRKRVFWTLYLLDW